MADFHVVDPLDEFVDVFRLLGRIGIVDVIKINMHDAHRFKLLNAANRVGKGFYRRISGNQQARDVAEVAHVCQPVLQGKGQLIALFLGDSERCTVSSPIGPHPGTRRFSRHLGDFIGDFPYVCGDPLIEVFIGFVMPRRVIKKTVSDGGFTASLRVGRNAVMRGPGMRANLNQRGLAELANHIPGGKAIAGRHQTAEVNFLICRRIHPAAHRCPQRRNVPGLKQGPDPGVKTAITVVEAEQNGFRRQRFFSFMRIQNVLHANGVIAVVQKPAYLLV